MTGPAVDGRPRGDGSVVGGPARGWQRRAPVIRAVVPCGDHEHVVVWRRGSLTAAHHDLPGEELLVALGADRSPCLEIVRGWRGGRIEPARPPGMTFYRLNPSSPPVAFMARRQVQALPEPLRRMRTLTMIGRRLPDEGDALLADRAHAALRSSSLRGHSVEVAVGPGPPALSHRRGHPIVVLQHRWLSHVWARQLEIVNGAFTLDAGARPGADGRIALQVVRWGDDGPYLADLRR